MLIIKDHYQYLYISIFIFFLSFLNLHAQVAFPGATGGGALSIGGRGGRVIEVTNLSDAGAGSLREALEASGPRTVVFKVGGTITLNSQIVIRDSYLTIAGQTAPGDGILIRSSAGMLYSPIMMMNCHDIIIRYIRVRPGPYAKNQAGDAINTYKLTYNIIIDHCSMSWSTDENTEVWSGIDPAYNITWSWNLIAEGLGSHSCGLLSGSDENSEGMHDVSVHHNIFVHNTRRNPLLKVKTAEIINNVVFGWKRFATQVGGGTTIDIIGNKYIKQEGISQNRREIVWKPYNPNLIVYGKPVKPPATGVEGNPSIYFEGNIGPNNADPTADAWMKMIEMADMDGWGYPDDDGHADRTDVPIAYRRNERRITSHPVELTDVLVLENSLTSTSGVGACRGLNEHGEWQLNRGVVDNRILHELATRSGNIPTTVTDGEFPVLNSATAYTDNDHDGMADIWEIENGLNPNDDSDRNLTNLSAVNYTNLEVFLNGEKVTSLAIEDIDIHLNFSVYPNPASKGIHLRTKGLTKEIEIQIVNTLGQVVLEKRFIATQDNYIDIQELTTGAYIITVFGEAKRLGSKILLVK